jgi:4-amino-4-deoxy-L-arabinose transferase-like glycosyltransferase
MGDLMANMLVQWTITAMQAIFLYYAPGNVIVGIAFGFCLGLAFLGTLQLDYRK